MEDGGREHPVGAGLERLGEMLEPAGTTGRDHRNRDRASGDPKQREIIALPGAVADLAAGAQRVLSLCDQKSVAEVSALASMPIGVVRVLLGDLVEQGLVQVQATITESSSKDERIELIERTLRGLRNY